TQHNLSIFDAYKSSRFSVYLYNLFVNLMTLSFSLRMFAGVFNQDLRVKTRKNGPGLKPQQTFAG
ncbi:MAG TPA: hypothetical protein VGP47_05195, partial [Parachlamydiaceae bacterium]|nr:hypothetical protein [Parachlamydiaceae bacterium]